MGRLSGPALRLYIRPDKLADKFMDPAWSSAPARIRRSAGRMALPTTTGICQRATERPLYRIGGSEKPTARAIVAD